MSDLDSKNEGKTLEARGVLENLFKDVFETENLIRNSRALMATTKVDNKNFVWITGADPQNNSRFKLDSY